MSWIQSYTGKVVTPLDLKPEQVCIEDIAHALSLKCRFTGHTREFYSVAQHCVEGACSMPPAFALPFLLHEVSEVYLPDIAGPIKHAVGVYYDDIDAWGAWVDLEARHARVILSALGLESLLPLLTSPQVKAMDLRMLATERRDLMGPPPEPWEEGLEPLEFTINPLGPQEAKTAFIYEFNHLSGAL